MPTIKLNDIEIYYELHGKGQPLVLIAGYSCDHLSWASMLDGLKQHFQVLIFDNRAIGQTKDSGADFTLEKMAEDSMQLIQQLGLKRPHIVGQSLGGAIAQTIARHYGDQINKLVILNSTVKFNARCIVAINSLLNLRKINMPVEEFIDANLPWFFSSEYLANAEMIALLKQIMMNNPHPQSLADQTRQNKLLPVFNSTSWLHEIKVPTLVVGAEDDIVCLPSESQYLVEKICGAKLASVPGGHASPVEQPDKLNSIIRTFLG